jgi:hypothetical protein
MRPVHGLGPWRETVVEVLGAEAMYGPHGRAGGREVVLRVGASHRERAALELLAAELAPFFTGGPPGLTTLFGGRPDVVPVLRFAAGLVPKPSVDVAVTLDEAPLSVAIPPGWPVEPPAAPRPEAVPPLPPCPVRVPLSALAWARSGDKGDSANVGVLARRPEYLAFLRAALTPEAVARHMAHVLAPGAGRVRRWDLPGLEGMNFLLERSLGGGGMASLRSDPQGKGFAQQLLEVEVPVTAEIAREALSAAPT